jgi:uncharacterized membrane protein
MWRLLCGPRLWSFSLGCWPTSVANRPVFRRSQRKRGYTWSSLDSQRGYRGSAIFTHLQIGPASRVAPIDKLSVALVILFAVLFLGEPLTWGKGVGCLLIVAGAIIIAVE